jgi:heme/copper-type cytochrome/quinol oxidase subunit 2
MNWKRFLWAGVAIFVVSQALSYVIDNFILMRDYEKLNSLWRPDVTSKVWLMYVIGFLVAFLFAYIFIKGREGKGIQEGVRFGIIIWLFTSVPFSLNLWILFPIPMALIVKWILYGLLTSLIGGILAAVIYKPLGAAKA